MNTSKTPRNTVWEDIKGTLADGQEYWVYRDKPWRTWDEQKDKYAKFADGTVRPFAGFEHLESIEFTTENYLGDSLDPAEVLGRCRCLIKFDGLLVYGFVRSGMSDALLHAYKCLDQLRWLRLTLFGNLNPERNLGHLINRPVFYREVPARVSHYAPGDGTLHLTAEKDHMFPPMGTHGDPRKTAQEDLLSELIRWNRDEGDS
jgi:hypothetical protein